MVPARTAPPCRRRAVSARVSSVGGLASGLGIGAGMVAGEELAQHLVNGSQSMTPGGSGTGDGDPLGNPGLSTADLGGNDFGITNDPGSWDDDSGADGGDGWS